MKLTILLLLGQASSLKLSQKNALRFVEGDFDDSNDDIIIKMHKTDSEISEEIKRFSRASNEERVKNLVQQMVPDPPRELAVPKAKVQTRQ